jgi:hypothetical protein
MPPAARSAAIDRLFVACSLPIDRLDPAALGCRKVGLRAGARYVGWA